MAPSFFFYLILAFSVQLHKEIQQTVFRFSFHNVPISFDPTIQRIISVCLFDLPKPTKTEKRIETHGHTHGWLRLGLREPFQQLSLAVLKTTVRVRNK